MHGGLFHQSCDCICNVCRLGGEVTCVANTIVVNGVKNMCEHILCPKGDTNEFHHKHCIPGHCAMCAVSTLQINLPSWNGQ
jgi:hypothetical protein